MMVWSKAALQIPQSPDPKISLAKFLGPANNK